MARALASRSTAMPRAPFNCSILPCKARRYQCHSTLSSANFMPFKPFHITVLISVVILKEDFRLKEEAYLTFHHKINDSITKKAIVRYHVILKNAVKYMDHVYCCYSRFLDLLQSESISNNNAVLIAVFETNVLYYYNLDICGCCSRSFNFCYNCWTCVSRGRKPKFGIFNRMPQLFCQCYPALLENLTSAKKTVIARVHLVITISKLRPNNSFNLGPYRGVCRHSVLLPQNPRPLLILLLLKTTFVGNLVRLI